MASSVHSASKIQGEAPSLSLDNLSPFHPSSPYLSPPSSVASSRSPPPRRETEDYFAINKTKSTKKHRTQNSTPRRSPLVQSEEIGPSERSSIIGTNPRISGVRNCESCNSRRNKNGIRNIPNPPPSLYTPKPQVPRPQFQRQENRIGLTPQARASFATAALQDLEDLEDSPAINSLRRVSRSFTQTPESNLRDLRHLSRTLTNKLSSVFASKSQSSGISEVDENRENLSAAGKGKAATMKIVADKDVSLPAIRNVLGGLNIPASITLRKASEALALSTTTNMDKTMTFDMADRAFNPNFHRQTTSNSLISFRSRHVDEDPSPTAPCISFSHQEELQSLQSDPSAEAPFSESQTPPSNITGNPMRQFSVPFAGQGRTSIAETALTFADFYPAPGTFIKPSCRANAVSPEKTPFYISITRILTSTRAHEIIWREGEISSSEGSLSLVSHTDRHRYSPTPTNISENDSVEGDAPGTTSFLASASPEEYDVSRTYNSEANELPMDPFEAQNRIFASWTWDNANSQRTENEKTTPNHNHFRSTTLQTNSNAAELRKTSLPTVQSSPNLSNRCSTSEQREESFMNLDDLSRSRATEQKSPFDGDINMELDRGLAMFMMRSQKMAASNYQSSAAARAGRAGSTGSLVGISSHARMK